MDPNNEKDPIIVNELIQNECKINTKYYRNGTKLYDALHSFLESSTAHIRWFSDKDFKSMLYLLTYENKDKKNLNLALKRWKKLLQIKP
jgi:hypothetical protein